MFLSIILTTSSKLYFPRIKNSEPQKSRVRKSSQDSGLSSRGRAPAVSRNLRAERTERTEGKRSAGGELSKSSSISNLSQARPRSTSLTRSQSQRLGGPGGSGAAGTARLSSAGRNSSERLVRPRSSTLGTSNCKGGADTHLHISSISLIKESFGDLSLNKPLPFLDFLSYHLLKDVYRYN